jgi:predicted metal-dependent hydrolase
VSFQRGIDDYLRGQHYEAHEHWEELWHEEGDDDRRRFLQALIQVASAVHKAVNDVAPRGSIRLLDAAHEKLEGLGDVYLGIDLAALRPAMAACRQEVARQLSETGHCRLPSAHVPPIVQLAAAPAFHKRAAKARVPVGAEDAWFQQGVTAYHQGDYFEAHEMWEDLWRDTPPGIDRTFLQGLIQVAAAMHKLRAHRKPSPAARLLGRAIDKLCLAPDGYRSVDTTRLLREARLAKQALEAVGELGAEQTPTLRLLGRPG